MELYAVRISGLKNPLGYHFAPLLCSWKVRGAKGKKQTNAVIEVSPDPAFGSATYTVSGADLDSLGVPLHMELAPRTRYYYRITVTSDAGETAQSEACWFETALLDEPWAAQWIGTAQEGNLHPEFMKRFAARKEIAQARLYICGLGLFEAYINGEKAGDDFLAPFINDYQEHVQYCAYDVTGLLAAQNELSVLLGKGWYMGRFGLSGAARPERNFSLIAQLHIRYADGSEDVIGTDESWLCRKSMLELTDIYDGETQDYLQWNQEENPWHGAKQIEAPAALTQRYSPPLHAMEAFPVKEVIHTPVGETVLDFGQNFAGYVECSQAIPRGTAMTLEFGEILQGGSFYHDNYRTAKSTFTYISDGVQRLIRPYFTFFGFRYVKVTGLESVESECFTGRAIYSEMDRTGFLDTGNEKINRLHENVLWGLRSNFVDIPTDCPQRDERLGWTGDAQVFCPTAGYLMDTRAFYAKFLRDLRSDQLRNNGKVAIYLPNEFPGLSASIWSDIATFMPQMLYTYYGSREMLAVNYPLMKDWVDSVQKEDRARGEKYLWDFGFQFGDWLALDGATQQSIFGRTDSSFIATAYYHASASYVAQAAKALGYAEAAAYEKLAEKIRQSFLQEYFTPSGRLAIDTQTGYLAALKFGLYINRQSVVEGLKARIKKDCRRIKGGFVGATMMNTVLADNGMADLAYDFLLFEGFPGWLYAVNLGATTIWERWNSVLPDGTISAAGMNSLNHYAYGSVMEFVYRHAAGISALCPGFRKARIAPLPDVRLLHLLCKFESAAGQYLSQWKIESNGSLTFHIEIPFGCEAEVILPEQEMQQLAAGSYDFTITPKRNYLALYSASTPVRGLLGDPRAVALLEEHLPEALRELNRNDEEAMSKSLEDWRYRAQLFRAPTQAYENAISAICKIQA